MLYQLEDEVLFYIKRNRRCRMNWRHRCFGLNTFELLYKEKLDKLQQGILTLNFFLIDVTTLLYHQIYFESKLKGISFDDYRKESPLTPIACNFFELLKNNINDLEIVDEEVSKLTSLIFPYRPYSLMEKMNRTIDSLKDDTEAYYLTRFNKEQLHSLFNHFRLPSFFTVHNTHHFSGEFVLLLSLAYLSSGENLKKLSYKFGGNELAFKAFIEHVYSLFYHKISGDSLRFYSEKNYRDFASLIYERVVSSSKEVDEYEKGKKDSIT